MDNDTKQFLPCLCFYLGSLLLVGLFALLRGLTP
jgi:hypothetical protein